MEQLNTEIPKRQSQRLRELFRKNSEKFGDAAESAVLPKNKRSFKRSASNGNADLDRSESVESIDPNKRSFPWLITLISFVQIFTMLISREFTWLSLCYDPFRRHEVWRLVSVCLVHVTYEHMGLNVIFQLILGLLLEVVHGWWRIGGIYLAGVMAGSLVHSVFQPKMYALGASAGVYGLLGAHLATLILNWSQMDRRVLRVVCLSAYFLLDILLAVFLPNPFVGYAGHAGGVIGGFVAALFLLRNFEVLPWEQNLKRIAGGGTVLAVLVLIAVNIFAVNNYFPTEYNSDYVKTYVGRIIDIFVEYCAKDPACSARYTKITNVTLSSTTAMPLF